MNNKGNIMLNLLFFVMALGVVIAFIGPINDFLGIAQQSDGLNCKDYIYDSNVSHPLSFDNLSNGGNSGSPIACIALKLYLPYILLVFLIGGIASVLSQRSEQMFFGTSPASEY